MRVYYATGIHERMHLMTAVLPAHRAVGDVVAR